MEKAKSVKNGEIVILLREYVGGTEGRDFETGLEILCFVTNGCTSFHHQT